MPPNPQQPEFKVDLPAPGLQHPQTVHGEPEVLQGLEQAQNIIAEQQPERIITLDGTCLVSLPAFD